MGDLVSLINHPGFPWGAGGVIGAIAGALVGQPDCTDRFSNPGLECTQAMLPLVDVSADVSVFIAVGTLIGVGVAFVAGKLNP